MKKHDSDFSQQLQQRSPDALKQGQERVLVTPVDRLAPQDQEEHLQGDKTTKRQNEKTTTQQDEKPTKKQTNKTTNQRVEKYTTHLRRETIKSIKRYAVEHDLKDYEVVQQALTQFFQ